MNNVPSLPESGGSGRMRAPQTCLSTATENCGNSSMVGERQPTKWQCLVLKAHKSAAYGSGRNRQTRQHAAHVALVYRQGLSVLFSSSSGVVVLFFCRSCPNAELVYMRAATDNNANTHAMPHAIGSMVGRQVGSRSFSSVGRPRKFFSKTFLFQPVHANLPSSKENATNVATAARAGKRRHAQKVVCVGQRCVVCKKSEWRKGWGRWGWCGGVQAGRNVAGRKRWGRRKSTAWYRQRGTALSSPSL